MSSSLIDSRVAVRVFGKDRQASRFVILDLELKTVSHVDRETGKRVCYPLFSEGGKSLNIRDAKTHGLSEAILKDVYGRFQKISNSSMEVV